ncbi:hypothetical protein Tcan_17492 [Toxocara canis]|uniref:Uncharacterized protein n=1 Tax=Toxocara canis TaxID=6265 RepID=A0A0B2VLR4_TOXCA|nr:hypothetical protein Tcan_17492 [Toxocara canis]
MIALYWIVPALVRKFCILIAKRGGIVVAIVRNGMRKSALAQKDSDRIIEATFRLLDQQ